MKNFNNLNHAWLSSTMLETKLLLIDNYSLMNSSYATKY